ncbi:MAG: hypothetical protein INQ03_11510 [Candidatus Heimdallarchaeota archaeon]|nr:hypothetical protein [Candidatus Heimdallarchaeota archaeon]
MKIGKFLPIILVISLFLSPGVSSELNLDHAAASDMDLPSIYVEDQPMVDNLVTVSVKFDNMAFVMVHAINEDNSTGSMLGHAHFMIPSGHSHYPATLDQMAMNPYEGGIVIHTLVKLPDSAENTRVRAMLVNDSNGDHLLQMGEDEIVMSNGKMVMGDFDVTGSLKTSIEVVDQVIDLNNPKVIISKVTVPGPAWQVIHLRTEEGKLGALVGRPVSIDHGINENVEVDLSISMDIINYTEGEPMKIFAHLHHDNFETGTFDPTTDPHVYSPNFDDPVLLNDTAQLFEATFGVTEEVPIDTWFMGLSLLVITNVMILKRRN